MPSTNSVTVWLEKLKASDPVAAQKLWELYFARLVGLARSRLRGAPLRSADEEDVALSAFDSFFRGAGRGIFPRLADRDDLWQILLVITERKLIDARQKEQAQKRGGGRVRDEATLGDPGEGGGLDALAGSDPTPEFAAQAAEELERLLTALQDAQLRSVAVWKMEGFTTEEIAAKLDCVPRTVERKLQLIRQAWESEAGR